MTKKNTHKLIIYVTFLLNLVAISASAFIMRSFFIETDITFAACIGGILTIVMLTLMINMLAESRSKVNSEIVFLLIISILNTVVVWLVSTIFGKYEYFDFKKLLIYCLILFVMLFVVNALSLVLLNKEHYSMLIIYNDTCPERFIHKLIRDYSRFGEVETYKIEKVDEKEYARFDHASDAFDQFLFLDGIDETVKSKYIMHVLKRNKVAKCIPNLTALSYTDGRLGVIGDTPVIQLKHRNIVLAEQMVKRIFDFGASLIASIVLLPLMLICAIAIKIDSQGPVFYKQERYTQYKKKFFVYKFRTMRNDAEKFGAKYAMEHDPRITKVGRILRALRLDELPQLLNILVGDMSIVGPRPERPIFADEYSKIVRNYDMRFFVKAGLTGYAQVYGKYNTRISDKQLFDIIYINKFSILLDLKIILRTILIIFTKEATEGVDDDSDNNKIDEKVENDEVNAK